MMFENIRADFLLYKHKNHFVWADFLSWFAVFPFRFGHWSAQQIKILRFVLYLFYYPLYMISLITSGIQIPKRTRIGKGLRIHHFGTLIINGGASIGDYCSLRPGVVIGNRYDGNDLPTIGNHVSVGVGAKILGNVKIGDNVAIGANAVVLCDVPSDSAAVGVPAKIVPRKRNK